MTKQIQEAIEIAKKVTGLEFLDSSWGNDECDSIYSELEGNTIKIFIPNSRKSNPDQEEHSTYQLNINEEYVDDYKTLEEALIKGKEIDSVHYPLWIMVDAAISDLFENAHTLIKTESGDITPEQSNTLEEIKADLKKLLVEQIIQNS